MRLTTLGGNVKLPSEKADSIIPFLQDIKQRFGDPLASVHDMGAGRQFLLMEGIETKDPWTK